MNINKTVANTAGRLKGSSLFKDSFWSVLGSVIGYGLSLLSGILIAREMGKDVYGEFGMIKQTLNYIAVISTFGLGATCTRYMAMYGKRHKVKTNVIFATLLISSIFSVFLGLLLLAFSRQLADLLESEDLLIPLRITAIILIFNSLFTSCQGLLSGEKQFKKIAIIKSIYGLVMLVSTVGLYKIWGLNGATIGLLVTFMVSSFLCLRNIVKRSLFRNFDSKKILGFSSHLIKFSTPIALQEAVNAIIQWLFIFIVIKLSDYGQLGIYTASAQWLAALSFIPTALRFVALSHLSSSSDDNTHKVILKRLIMISLVTTLTPLVVLIPLSGFISSFYGSTFVGMPVVLCVLCSASVFDSLMMTISQELTAQGRTWVVCNSRLTGQILTLFLTIWLIKMWSVSGALAASVGVLSSSCIIVILLFYFYYRKQSLENK